MTIRLAAHTLTALLLAVSLGTLTTLAQYGSISASPSGWTRVHSDNGEFSIDVPAEYAYFADDAGFWVSKAGNDIPLRKMRSLNAMKDGTFISFEVYEAGKDALDRIYESDKGHSNVYKADRSKLAGVEIRQIDYKSDKATWTRKFFRSKTHIYILTAGSREPASNVASHFFGSLVFDPSTNSQSGKGTSFSSLHITAPVVQMLDKIDQPATPQQEPQKLDPNRPMPVIMSKPQASYVDAARESNVQGSVRLKVKLAKDGSIPEITVVSGLPSGLSRQAVFAAMRIKFLPKLENGQHADSTVTIEYSFRFF